MKVGDLVTIFWSSRATNVSEPINVETKGVIVEILGHKTSVLVDGELESWDISDLISMEEAYASR